MNARLLRCFLVSLAACAIPALAGPIISNIPTNGTGVSGTIVGSATRSYAQGFTMSSSAYSLDSVDMDLTVNAGGRNFTLELYGGSSNPSGSALDSFTVQVLNTVGEALYNFTPTSSFTLQANTTYWLVAYSLTTGSANQITWNGSNPAVTPTGIATYAGNRFDTPAVIPPTDNTVVFVPSFQINGTLAGVPEPSTTAMSVLALAALAGLRKAIR